jgi:hypothetical protein
MRKNSRQTLRDQALKIIRTWERARRKPRRAEVSLVWFGLVWLSYSVSAAYCAAMPGVTGCGRLRTQRGC